MKHDQVDPDEFIDARGWSDGEIIRASLYVQKTGVGQSDYADALQHSPAADDFSEALRAVTVFDRLGGRKVPLLVRLLDGSAAIAYWVQGGRPIPLTRNALTGSSLDVRKVAALAVLPNEILRDESADGDQRLSTDLVNAAAEASDVALLDPDNAGSASTPASITNGVSAIPSTGSSLAQVDGDLKLVLQAVIDAGSTLAAAKWILRPKTAVYLSALRGTGGAPAFPSITVKGGELLGLPVVVSGNVPATSSPGEAAITLVDTDDFVYGDLGAVVSLSSQGTIEMDDSPTGNTTTPVAASAHLVSLFQEDATAVKIIRACSWMMRKPTVSYIGGVTY